MLVPAGRTGFRSKAEWPLPEPWLLRLLAIHSTSTCLPLAPTTVHTVAGGVDAAVANAGLPPDTQHAALRQPLPSSRASPISSICSRPHRMARSCPIGGTLGSVGETGFKYRVG